MAILNLFEALAPALGLGSQVTKGEILNLSSAWR